MTILTKICKQPRHLPAALGLAALATFGPQAAAALTECHFEVECYEAEACTQSSFALELSGDVSTLSTEYEQIPVLHDDVVDQSTNIYYAAGAGARYLLSIYESGAARLSVHMTGDPVALTYIGTCAGLEDNWSG